MDDRIFHLKMQNISEKKKIGIVNVMSLAPSLEGELDGVFMLYFSLIIGPSTWHGT